MTEFPLPSTAEVPPYTPDSTLLNANADIAAKTAMNFLTEQYGKKILTGQYISTAEMPEINAIETVTGRRPALLLADLGGASPELVDAALSWGESGGLVSLMWHWEAPVGEKSVYAEQTAFDLTKAVTTLDIAQKSSQEIEEFRKSGKISEETAALLRDIDAVSEQLKRFQEKGVPVLWRPLHEASGGWFWWGSKGEEAYLWLWRLMVERQTHYHNLNNLLWVWNGQAADWYVGDDFCDIISADIYDEEGKSIGAEVFLQFDSIAAGKKILAVSECGTIPDPDELFAQKSVWSYFGLWYGEYILDEAGEFNPAFTSRDRLIKAYNSEATLTFDELPDFYQKE